MVSVDPGVVSSISDRLGSSLGSLGFEFHTFKVEWYNAFVQPAFKLKYADNTIAFLIVSTPRMFESIFIPFLKRKSQTMEDYAKDPIDECMVCYLSKISAMYPEYNVKIMHDFEVYPNRKPKIVMQSASHASGAAYYYHPDSIYLDKSVQKKKMFGVCIHPVYSGWFALRAVAFFEDLQCPDLTRVPPLNVVPSIEDQTKLLELYNFSWADWKYRDIIPAKEKYSDLQIKYFSTLPGYRECVIKEILDTCSVAESES